MKRIILLLSCIALLRVASAQVLWYRQPAATWNEALPIGNGRLGAMVFGGVEQDHLQFNEETLWTGEPRDYNQQGAWAYLDTIRQLLFAGRQQEAEAIAEEHFMGLKSKEGDREAWNAKVLASALKPGGPMKADFDDNSWKTIPVPAYEGWESVGLEGLDGAVWLRTEFEIPGKWVGKEVTLDLNRVRDCDWTYINGTLVGQTTSTDARRYSIPANLLHAGKNSIAVLVVNYDNKGGIAGYKDTTRSIGVYLPGDPSDRVSLKGNWRYFIANDDPPPVGKYQADYQPFGDLWLNFPKQEISGYRRQLDLSTAIAAVSYSANGVHYKREYFASAPDQVIAVHLTASKPGMLSLSAALGSVHKIKSVRKISTSTLSLFVQVKNGALHGESWLKVIAPGGRVSTDSLGIRIDKANEVVIYLAAATNYKRYDDVSGDAGAACRKVLTALKRYSFAAAKARHTNEYQGYYKKFALGLGRGNDNEKPTDVRIRDFANGNDPAFAALYVQYGRYLLISSSRPGTRPANLQGIWNDLLTPPWGSKYTTNINLEMNYWPAELLHLSPLQQPLFTMIAELAERGTETAAAYYHAPGWVLHHNTDLWRGTAPINASNHGIWVSGGAWLCHHLWEHYLFTQNKAFLRDTAYPLMRSAAEFFNTFLVRDPATGWLISTPSNSPEQGGLVAGPTMDHQIIRDLFKNVITASELLHVDAAFRDSLRIKYSQIAPEQVGKYGQLQEWLQDKDDTANKHRHISHLWAEFPGNEINWDEKPELMKAARQSLLYRGDEATGWSIGWKMNCWARFLDGEHAYRMLKLLLSPAGSGAGSYPNLFDAHPPFQIDGNFGGAAGIAEMLLQSHTGYIDILPALPGEWKDGFVRGICARGGFVLDFSWSNGNLQAVTVHSVAGNDCRLRYRGKVYHLFTQQGKVYRVDLSKLK